MAAMAAGISALLGGCSGSFMADHLPAAAGGLPEGAPARPTEQAYPAVHNVPPSRNSPPLSEDQQKQLADELEAARNRANQDAPATTGSTTNSQAGSPRNQ